MSHVRVLAGLALAALAPGFAFAEPFELKEGDRVVFLGNTLIERAQSFGYIEAALTSHWPGRNIVFRNLGWSGDNVGGHSRAGFGSPESGFEQLKKHVAMAQPTVLIVGYGWNESFEGSAGVPSFTAGLTRLLDTIAPTSSPSPVRLVLLSPQPHEDMGRPLPDPTAHNRDLAAYRDAVRDVAAKRSARFVDLYTPLLKEESAANSTGSGHHRRLTNNGIHFTAYGYWRLAQAIEAGLELSPPTWSVEISDGKSKSSHGTKLSDLAATADGLRFTAIDEMLPACPPANSKGTPDPRTATKTGTLKVTGLAAGTYTLSVDDKPIAEATHQQWSAGAQISNVPALDQAEALRAEIVIKNERYFHRWRPQNETYLFGFRKHEQGNNAKEVPLFEPVVAAHEKEIARLRVPVAHRFVLKRK